MRSPKKETKKQKLTKAGKRLEDEEKIADAIDTEDLGARADMEWTKEKDERLGL